MKKVFLLLMLFIPLLAASQISQYTAFRIYAIDSFRLGDRWIRKISTNLNSSDSNSHNMIATNRAIMDMIRSGATPTFANNGTKKSGDTVQLDRINILTNTADGRVDINNYFIDAVAGNNSNDGRTEITAKKTIASVNNALQALSLYDRQSRLGIKNNSYLHEQFNSVGNMKVGGYGFYGMGKIVPAAINGADSAGAWTDTSNMFMQTWSHDLGLANPDYNYVFVAEIDTAKEKIAPYSARNYLKFALSRLDCDTTPGSCFTVDITVNPVTVYIHPSDDSDPAASKYRYEIVKREYCFNSHNPSYFKNNVIEKLWLLNSGHGYGMVGSGDSTIISKCILQGGGTHNAVIASGIVDRNVWLPGPHLPTGSYTIVSYESDATGNNTRYTNNIFFDGLNEIYAHESIGSYANDIVVDGNYFFGDTVGNYSGAPFAADNMTNGYFANNYVYGYQSWGAGLTLNQRYVNNIFNRISARSGINYPDNNPAMFYWKNNLLINEGESTGLGMYGMWLSQAGNKAVIENSIWHSKASIEYNFFFGTGGAAPDQFKSHRNIFLIDNETGIFSVIVQTSKGNGSPAPASIGYKGDSNVYIIVNGDVMWRQVNPTLNHQNIQSWRDSTGQDLNSLVFYASNYANGLKTFFVDPANGDYTIAPTPQGDSIRSIQAGMIAPPTSFPSRPTYEQAVESILNPGTPADAWKYGGSKEVVQPGDFIINQNAAKESKDFWVNSGKIGGGVTLQQQVGGGGTGGLLISSNNEDNTITVQNENANGFSGFTFKNNSGTTTGIVSMPNATANMRIETGTSKAIDLGTNGLGTPKARLSVSGNFIVGTPASEVGGYTLQSTGGLLSTGPITFDLPSSATGDLYARNGSGVLVPIAPGTSGQVLTSNGAGSVPSYQSVTSGITSINSQTGPAITFATGTTGNDFNIAQASNTVTFHLPSASSTARGAVSTTTQTFAGAKTFNEQVTVNPTTHAAKIRLQGNINSNTEVGVGGVSFQADGITFNDGGAARTVSNGNRFHFFGQPTVTATNAVTYSNFTATVGIVGAPIAGTNMTLTTPYALHANDVSYFEGFALGVNEQSSAITLADPTINIYNGTADTWTLPALAANPGKVYYIKNAGSGDLTIQRAGSDNIYTTSSVTSFTIAAGASKKIVGGTSFWYVLD